MRNDAATFHTSGNEESVRARGAGVSIPLENIPRKGRSITSDGFFENRVSNSSDAYRTAYNSTNSGFSNRTFFTHHDAVRHVEARRYRNYSDGIPDKRVLENDHIDLKMSRDELGNARLTNQIGEDRYQRTGHSPDLKIQGRDKDEVRGLNSNYSYEGPSNIYSGDGYVRYDEKVLNDHNESLDKLNRVDYLKLDRAELLRKLEELNNHLDGSLNIVEKPKLDTRNGHQEPYAAAWFAGGSTSTNTTSMQYFSHDTRSTKPHYDHHHSEPDWVVNRGETGMRSLYDHPSYADPSQYQQQPSHPHFSRQYIDNDLDQFEPFLTHHPSCTCTYCYDYHRQAPPPMPACTHKNPTHYNHKKPNAFDQQGFNPGSPTLSQTSYQDTRSHTRWSADVNFDMGGGVKSLPHKLVPARNARRCRPVGGGAPFIACCYCFALLQLPKRVLREDKNEQKVKCGACFVILSCAVLDKEIVISVFIEIKQTAIPSVNNNTDQVGKHSRCNTNESENLLSVDFDSSGDIRSMGTSHIQSLPDHDFNTRKTREKREIHSSSAISTKDEVSRDGLITGEELVTVNFIDQPNKPTLYPLPPGTSLQEYFDYSSNNHRPPSTHSAQDKFKGSASVATEIEVISFNGYSQTGVSVDSGDTSREEKIKRKFNSPERIVQKKLDPSQAVGDGKSNMLNGRPLPDFLRRPERQAEPVPTVEDGKINVKINGRPLPDHLVKKAERLAGPIQTGEYWYDYRAGFWGVTGGPCLGIIPPYIEEFNYPMREDCAGGNTSVYVNGRELHSRDLKMLMSRGLPPGRDKSYVIDITGKVIDEDTGDELDSLGKLAPTVEKAKHGFGMKAPRSSAR